MALGPSAAANFKPEGIIDIMYVRIKVRIKEYILKSTH